VPSLANPLPSGKEQCGAALRGHACDDISRISSAYRFQRRQRSEGAKCRARERLLAGKISNTMFSGSDELYDVDGAKVHPKVIMWIFFTLTFYLFKRSRAAKGGKAVFGKRGR